MVRIFERTMELHPSVARSGVKPESDSAAPAGVKLPRLAVAAKLELEDVMVTASPGCSPAVEPATRPPSPVGKMLDEEATSLNPDAASAAAPRKRASAVPKRSQKAVPAVAASALVEDESAGTERRILPPRSSRNLAAGANTEENAEDVDEDNAPVDYIEGT
jgi:hypothetical protein